MFSKSQRISRQKIGEIFKNSENSLKHKYFSIKVGKNEDGLAKFAVIISKKKIKSAVKRHFIKRKIIESLKKTPFPLNTDNVFILLNFSDDFFIELDKFLKEVYY